MRKETTLSLDEQIREALDNPGKVDKLNEAMSRGRRAPKIALHRFHRDESYRDRTHDVKERCIAQLDTLLPRFVAAAEARGAKVFLARDGAAALEYIAKLARDRGAKTFAKSKSLTSEEIEFNHPLIHDGFEVVETDLGELIIQLAGERPSHLTAPAVHKTAAEIAEIFHKETGLEVPSEPEKIVKIARAYLRPRFLNAHIGVTGTNVCIAETGGICVFTNEGNARLVSTAPDIHIAIGGIEKIVDTLEDALTVAQAHAMAGMATCITTYSTWMAGRNPLGSDGGPRESHIVLLDNGRTKMREDPWLREALNCVRCGACMAACPTFGVVGGHVFGDIYMGPIGIPWTAGAHGLERAGAFAPLCISCGLCKEICPAKIDLPMIISKVKDDFNNAEAGGNGNAQPLVNRVMMRSDSAAGLGSATAPLSNWALKNPLVRGLMEKTVGIDRRRALPAFQRATLKSKLANRSGSAANPKRRVALFVDIFFNNNRPDLGMAAVEALEARGCEVIAPEQKWSGYPHISYGDMKGARKIAAYNIERFARLVREGFDVVAIEPTASYCLLKAYPKLFSHDAEIGGDGALYDAAKSVAAKSYEIFEYLLRLDAEGALGSSALHGGTAASSASGKNLSGRKYGFHIPCHQRPLGSGRHAIEWLRARGAEVEVVETGTCCGMAGTFGLKTGPQGYDLSMAIGAPLFDLFNKAGVQAIVTESSVCRMQLGEGTGLPVLHPLEV